MTDSMFSRRDTLALMVAAGGTLAAGPSFAQDLHAGTEDMILGDLDAPVEVIEYASLTCPHCASWHIQVWPRLRSEYVDTGKVKFVFREVYFDRFGLWGAMLARCDRTRYFGIVDLLLKTQRDWSRAGDPAAIVGAMRRVGAQAGLSAEMMDQCLSDGTLAESLVATYQENAQRHNVTGTPTFVIQGTTYGNMGFDQFAEIIDGHLA